MLAAITEAASQGDHKAAEWIAGLAKTPEKIKEILGAGGEEEEEEEEDEEDEGGDDE